MKHQINEEELKKFLNKANKNTYANKDARKVTSTKLKSEDYQYIEGDLIFHDTFFGSRDFIGEEIVYKKQKPVWGANYFGFVLDGNMDESKVYGFLRKALMQDYEIDIPVRGPKEFSNGEWVYKFSYIGNLGNFSGEEIIFFKGNIVYRCLVHGGFIK